jgi:hypothetical protein
MMSGVRGRKSSSSTPSSSVTAARQLPARSSRGQRDALSDWSSYDQALYYDRVKHLQEFREKQQIKRVRQQQGITDDIDNEDEVEEEEGKPSPRKSPSKRRSKSPAKKQRKKSSSSSSSSSKKSKSSSKVRSDDDTAVDAGEEQEVEGEEDQDQDQEETDTEAVQQSASKSKKGSKKSDAATNGTGTGSDVPYSQNIPSLPSLDGETDKVSDKEFGLDHAVKIVQQVIGQLSSFDAVTKFMNTAAKFAKDRIRDISDLKEATNAAVDSAEADVQQTRREVQKT